MDQSVHLCSPGTMVTIRARVQEVFLARARFHHFGTGSAKTGAQSDLCPLLTSAELNKCDEVVIGCQSDFECLTDERCCFSMCEDKCVKVHDSFCPYPGMARTECSLKNQQVTCYDDSNCAGDEKCCYEMCNRKCMKSVPVHDSFCPYPGMARTECSLKNQQVTCYDDSNCAGDEKCCYEMCNRKCMKSVPDTVHAGFCPPPIAVNTCFVLFQQDMCASDSTCATDEKCCSTWCNRMCRKSVAERTD
ncbi:WAP four-disulfide core domain protein 8-like isoform X3 [Pleurodeles waltl]|uniref:WAP four-disulfide core domain protein 8-like isoform X3 n=1 Tax=Pleurodeles waltl TaxID=8319 RepID=UPI0037099DA6